MEQVQWLNESVGIFNGRLVEKDKEGNPKIIPANRLVLFMNMDRHWQLGPGYKLLRMRVNDSGLVIKRLEYADGKIVDIPFTTAGLHKRKKRKTLKMSSGDGETLFDTEQYR